jgi:hypothetical protein
MATANELLNRSKSKSIENVCINAMENTTDEYTQANRLQMLYGKDRNNEIIGTYKNARYKAKKQAMNPRAGGYVDLRLTGRYYQSIKATVSGTEVLVIASDSKAKMLEEKYGESIYGIGYDFRKRYLTILKKETINEFNK